MDIMEEEEEIPVKYRLSGETDWQFKSEAVMKLGKTEWAIRLKLCRQAENLRYYSLHVALLTLGHQSRIQIKCSREGETNPDWLQEYTFGGIQSNLINPCLMQVSEEQLQEKVTFLVELKLLSDVETTVFNWPSEVSFPRADYTLKVEDKMLKLDSAYLKRRNPLLGYLFEDEEKKEYVVDNFQFEDLVDAFGILQHKWELPANRLLHLIPIARKLGFDIWGKSLNREFSQLMYADPVKIVPEENEEPTMIQNNTALKWTVESFEMIGSSTLPDNQNLLVNWGEENKNCVIYMYTQDILGVKYLSLGFQMSRPSTSTESFNENVNVTDESDSTNPEDIRSKYFDVDIHLINGEGVRLISDKIHRIKEDPYILVGSPVFAPFEEVMKHSTDGKIHFEINWIENHDEEEDDVRKFKMPGVTNGEIVCEGKVVKINKEYLSQQSEYFRGMFSKRFKEGEQECINLPIEQFNVLKMALELVYNRRLVLTDIEISLILDFADRTCFKSIIDGLQRQLWGSKVMDVSDKKWLAEQFMLTDLEMKCSMEENEETLKVARASRKRTRPVDFVDDPLQPPPAPNPERVLQELEELPVLNQQSTV